MRQTLLREALSPDVQINRRGGDGAENRVRERIVVGVKIGLAAGAAFGIIALPFALFGALTGNRGGTVAGSWSFGTTLVLYLAGGVLGGALVGLIWPIRRWWVGRRILGWLAVLPISLGTGRIVCGEAGWSADGTWCDPRVWLFSALVYGVCLSFVIEKRARHW